MRTTEPARQCLNLRPLAVAIAAAACLMVAGGLLQSAGAAIVSVGDVLPNPTGGTVVGRLSIGISGSGSVAVNGGSSLTGDVIGLGEQSTGLGILSLTGLGSSLTLVPTGTAGNLDIGSAGTGIVSVLNGASFAYGVAVNNACALNCRLFVSNAAGSNGSVLVNGAGSLFTTPGDVTVGSASVFTVATDGFNYGTPGGASQGSFSVAAGGTVSSSRLNIGTPGGGLGRNGSEQSSGSVLVDGAGSVWTIVRQATQTAAIGMLRLGAGANSQGTLDITNGGRVRIDGNAALNLPLNGNLFAGANIGNGGATSSGIVSVDGAGSRLEVAGPLGFINVGVDVAGSNGQLQVTNGGLVTGIGSNGLPFLTIGRNGGTGSLSVSGNDASGNASTVRLAGRNPVTDAGAFLSVGRNDGTGAATGVVDVLGGGRIEIDTTALALTNPDGQTGMFIGVRAGSSGTLNIAGTSALTGAASSFAILAGSGLTPYVGIGRDGATGVVNITSGGKLTVDSSHVSVPNPGGYLPGDGQFFDIGRRVGAGAGASVGTVNVIGIGSELALTGSADRFIQLGFGNGAVGTLNVLAGGKVSSVSMLLGQGGSGALTLNNGQIELGGVFNGGPPAGFGGGLSVGRSGGVGVASIGNGSTVTISSTAPRAGLSVGGSPFAPGGIGSVSISGGSTFTATGPQALIAVGRAGTAGDIGIGSLTLSGAGSSLSAIGTDAKILIGAAANTIGTLFVGTGATLTSSSIIGVGHDGAANTGGVGTLMANGAATAPNIYIGSTGLLGGRGVMNGTVILHGTLSPGESPGRLVINGAIETPSGLLLLDVASNGLGGYDIDHLALTVGSTFDFTGLEVKFNFLGNTDPNAFAASGGMDLDNFLQSINPLGEIAALSTQFAPGVTWASWFSSSQFSATSEAYHITGFSFSPDGTVSFIAAAVPEPDTLALALLGFLGAGAFSLRRRCVLRRI